MPLIEKYNSLVGQKSATDLAGLTMEPCSKRALLRNKIERHILQCHSSVLLPITLSFVKSRVSLLVKHKWTVKTRTRYEVQEMFNPLNPKIDQHQISPCNSNAL